MTFNTLFRVFAFAVVAVATLGAQQAPPKQAGGIAVVDITKGQAVVLDVNYTTRNVTVTINGSCTTTRSATASKGS